MDNNNNSELLLSEKELPLDLIDELDEKEVEYRRNEARRLKDNIRDWEYYQ